MKLLFSYSFLNCFRDLLLTMVATPLNAPINSPRPTDLHAHPRRSGNPIPRTRRNTQMWTQVSYKLPVKIKRSPVIVPFPNLRAAIPSSYSGAPPTSLTTPTIITPTISLLVWNPNPSSTPPACASAHRRAASLRIGRVPTAPPFSLPSQTYPTPRHSTPASSVTQTNHPVRVPRLTASVAFYFPPHFDSHLPVLNSNSTYP